MSDIIKKFVTLKDGSKLFYASERSVRNEAKDFVGEIVGINGPSDLEAGVYEGGLKVWECSVDLCNFLLTNYSTMTGIDVLELGCGAALPSIVALRKAANSICVQDFNSFVVECFTKKNFELNGVKSDGEKCTFVGGEWGADIAGKIGPKKFNLILTSETIYNEFNYASLHHTMDSLLTDDGKASGSQSPLLWRWRKRFGLFRIRPLPGDVRFRGRSLEHKNKFHPTQNFVIIAKNGVK
uniref:protein-histidine N-methyltransferase n=1 Tax=Globodera rostochiensis TaxID=31243 RepID=A0A914HAU5_GLORO